VLWSEVADLEAASGFARSTVGLAGCTVCGTFLVASDDVQNELLKVCRDVRPALAATRVGITRVPGVLIARYLGNSSEEVFTYFKELWSVLRPALSAKVACAPRVWAC
jgi:urease accessory protein